MTAPFGPTSSELIVSPWLADFGASGYLTAATALASPAPCPGRGWNVPTVGSVVPSLVAVWATSHLTWSLVHSGCTWKTSAARPATTGAAIDVPDIRM